MDQINGYPIIKTHDTPKASMTRAGRVILVDRGAESSARFVTAWQGRDGTKWDSSWCHGHYIAKKADALVDFRLRARAGY